MNKFFANVIALMVFVGLVSFMLWLNDWGQSVPDDSVQMIWGFNFAIWPWLTYDAIRKLKKP